MLYNSFRVTVMIASVMAMLHMFSESNYTYILFPIIIIFWGLFSFFDEEDKEYLRRNGINPDEYSWFFPDYSSYGHTKSYSSSSYNSSYNDHTRYMPSQTTTQTYSHHTSGYVNPSYDGFKKKCKRNFKITIEEKGNT